MIITCNFRCHLQESSFFIIYLDKKPSLFKGIFESVTNENKPLEWDIKLNKTNGKSEERILVSVNCSINGGTQRDFDSSWRSDTEWKGGEGYSGKARVAWSYSNKGLDVLGGLSNLFSL